MKLYKNVDIRDLKSIFENGILSLDESGNDNWEDGKRANNDTNVVYLFSPISKLNTFCQYGIVLLEIEIDESLVRKNEMIECDVNKDLYVEYVADFVPSECIKKAFIPALFKSRCELSDNVEKLVAWCGMAADFYGLNGLEKCTDEVLKKFSDTTEINSTCFNFFRGENEDRTVVDLYNVKYIF